MLDIIIGAVVGVAKALSIAGLAIEGLKAVVGLLVNIGKALGLVETPDPERPEKALQAEEEEGIRPENFDTYDEYLKAIDEFEIDPEKKHTEEELLNKEIEILSGSILEIAPELPLEDAIKAVGKNPEYLNETRLSEIGNACGGDAEKLQEVFGLINETEKNVGKLENAEKTLIDIEKKLDPTLSDQQALEIVYKNI